MHLFEEQHKQKTAMELLEQHMQFKQEAEKDCKEEQVKCTLLSSIECGVCDLNMLLI